MLISTGPLCIPSSTSLPPDEEEDGGIEGLLLLLVDVYSIFSFDNNSLATIISKNTLD
jgi:hypothetical protein